jgi:hypothetical protein
MQLPDAPDAVAKSFNPRIRALVGTPVPAVTRTGASLGTWLTAVPRTWRTA